VCLEANRQISCDWTGCLGLRIYVTYSRYDIFLGKLAPPEFFQSLSLLAFDCRYKFRIFAKFYSGNLGTVCGIARFN
jgi:hypothetical protein